MKDGKGQTTNYSYDALDHMIQLSYAGGSSASFTYDADGNRTAMTDSTGTTSYTYDSLNRPTKKTLPSGQAITYTWDNVGNLTSKADNGGTVTLSYNLLNLLASEKDPTGASTSFQYDAAYRRTQTAYPNGVTVTFGLDPSGQITNITAKNNTGTTLLSRTYSYVNPANNQTTTERFSSSDQASNAVSYTYDALTRLSEAKTKNSVGTVTDDRTYSYDATSNRLSQNINGAVTSYAYNAANELCWKYGGSSSAACSSPPGGSVTYSYDGNGSLTSRSDGLSLSYNSANFTTTVTPPGGSAMNMAYTGIDQTERVQAGTTSFTYDLMGQSQRADSSGTVYDLRDNAGQLISERTPHGTYYVIPDALQSTIGLTDSGANLVGNWTYDPWGNVISQTGTVTTPFLFAGAYFDSSTGLYKMGARYYDPSVGRWTQLDPVFGVLTNPQSLNRFLYVSNDPIRSSDRSGYFCWTYFIAGLLLVAAAIWFIVLGILLLPVGGWALIIVGLALLALAGWFFWLAWHTWWCF